MGVVVKCTSCSKTSRYDSGEIYEIPGSWYVDCESCASPILVMKTNLAAQVVSLGNKQVQKRDATERAENSGIREYWIQMYFKENYHKYEAFSEIEGPFGNGPDFRGKYKGVDTYIEIERNCSNYIQHKHHLDERFNKVTVLVVLSKYDNDGLIEALPKHVEYLNIADFVGWFKPQAREYAIQKQYEHYVERIGDFFRKIYIQDCSDKERDMAVCPHCELCPYFREGEGEGWTAFNVMALGFMTFKGIGRLNIDQGIEELEPDELYEFYCDYADAYLF